MVEYAAPTVVRRIRLLHFKSVGMFYCRRLIRSEEICEPWIGPSARL